VWFAFVSGGSELLLEIAWQIGRRLVEIAGGVVEQVAQQAFGDGA
jgi:hypothetical protein